MADLHEKIAEYPDEYLLSQYFKHKDEYTAEALGIMREAITQRGLSEEQITKYLDEERGAPEQKAYESEDFVAFDHAFTQTDILLAHAILRDAKIPFYIDNPTSSDTIPLESVAQKRISIHVHKDFEQKAHETLDEHFDKSDGVYMLRHTSTKDRLRAFNFYDIRLDEFEAAQKLETDLSEPERATILLLGERLLGEADDIEQKQQRVIFYYDNVEPLLELLHKNEKLLSRTDLLTILEILQIYCDDPQFPQSIEGCVASLLQLFTGH